MECKAGEMSIQIDNIGVHGGGEKGKGNGVKNIRRKSGKSTSEVEEKEEDVDVYLREQDG